VARQDARKLFAARLAALLEQRGARAKLSKNGRFSASTVTRWAAESQGVSFENLGPIADGLGLQVAELFLAEGYRVVRSEADAGRDLGFHTGTQLSGGPTPMPEGAPISDQPEADLESRRRLRDALDDVQVALTNIAAEFGDVDSRPHRGATRNTQHAKAGARRRHRKTG